MDLRIVVIHDDPVLREFLAEAVEGLSDYNVTATTSSFDIRLPSLWHTWKSEADIFLIGLERRYERGQRAEGAKVAENLFASGKRALVIGTEANGSRLCLPFYWDLASNESFFRAIGECLNLPIPAPAEIATMLEFFKDRIAIPTGH